MIHIDAQLAMPVDQALLKAAASSALTYARTGQDVELTLVIADDTLLQQYNQQYLGVNAPTDVLSFPADHTDPDSQAHYLGDVLIALPRAQQQAETGGHTLEEELQMLVVHGVLHLLGYDHGEIADIAQMQEAQDAIMASLGSHNSPHLGIASSGD